MKLDQTIPEELAVYFGLDTVAVYPKNGRNTKTNLVVGPFARTTENIRYCNAIVDAANREYRQILEAA